MPSPIPEESLIKSQDRVRDHGEVFTPTAMVNQMLDLVKEDLEDTPDFVDKTFFEPSAGTGNFLKQILQRKLDAVEQSFPSEQWQPESLFALASIYGVELLEDNHHAAQQSLLNVFLEFHSKAGIACHPKANIYQAATKLIECNILRGNTLTSLDSQGHELQFSWWHRINKGTHNVQREPFSLSSLRSASHGIEMFDFMQYEVYEVCRIEHVYMELRK